jgi:hypothetical protein
MIKTNRRRLSLSMMSKILRAFFLFFAQHQGEYYYGQTLPNIVPKTSPSMAENAEWPPP